MTSDARAKRMAVRFTDDDLAWLTEQAEDEGVEAATLVRMIVARLRKGRSPLVSMMGQPARPALDVMREMRAAYVPGVYQPPVPELGGVMGTDPEMVEDILRQRLSEMGADAGEVVPMDDGHNDESVAIPLRRIPRQQYNPGRR